MTRLLLHSLASTRRVETSCHVKRRTMRRTQRRRHLDPAALLLVCLAAIGASDDKARSATTTATHHRIVFEASQNGNRDIYSMNDDGSDVQRLTSNPDDEYGPAWSPSGSQIAFWRTNRADPLGQTRLFAQLLVMDADGSDQRVIWTGTKRVHDHANSPPSWSPDAAYVAFESNEDQSEGTSIYTIGLDGSKLLRVTRDNEEMIDVGPAWAPDGKKIYFMRQDWSAPDIEPEPTFQIFSIRRDGSGLKAITSDPTYHWGPKPSPDGKHILFTRGDKELTWTRIFVMNPDGSGMRRIGRGETFDGGAAWAPGAEAIVFTRDPDGGTATRGCVIEPGPTADCDYAIGPMPTDIFTMRLDGSAVRQLTDTLGDERHPSFAL